MYQDPRGGHNRVKVNVHFFKVWSHKMAYVLGLICADGAVEDVRSSSRTCYTQLTSVDSQLLEEVKLCMGSRHRLSIRPPRKEKIMNKVYFCSQSYNLRIGSKEMFQDLVNLGVTPRKSLRLGFPPVPDIYLNSFIRGYFDGDGCVSVSQQKDRIKERIQVVFTSGCKNFLEILARKLSVLVEGNKNIWFNSGGFRLAYSGKHALEVLAFMYSSLSAAPILERKHRIYTKYLSLVS